MKLKSFLVLGSLTLAAPAFAGPVVLGGDDLNCHGERDINNDNIQGWLYIEKIFGSVNSQVTRPGPFTVDIAMLGTPAPANCPPTCPGGADDAAGSAADKAGLTISYFDGDAAIDGFFDDLAQGTVNPKIIYLPGTDCSPDLDSNEGAELVQNAGAIQAFVGSGGGLISHGCEDSGDCAIAYGWLNALTPGLVVNGNNACNSTNAQLTAAGQAALPTVSNSDIDGNAGPCHNTFEGNFGELQPLAVDGDDDPFILGGIVTTLAEPSGVPAAGAAGLLAVCGLLLGVARRRLQPTR